jgi:hypothetical protein
VQHPLRVPHRSAASIPMRSWQRWSAMPARSWSRA